MEDGEDTLSAPYRRPVRRRPPGAFSCGVDNIAEVQNIRIYEYNLPRTQHL